MSAIAVQPRIATARSRVVVDGPWGPAVPGTRPAVPRSAASSSAASSSAASRPAVSRPAVRRPVEGRVAAGSAPSTRPAGRPAVVRASATRSAGPRPTPLHLTRRGRAVVVLLGLLVVVAGVMGGRAVAEGPERGLEVVSYSVQAGETLWQIASGVAEPGEDVRDVVLRLQDLNGMRDGSLTAGDVILLPAAG